MSKFKFHQIRSLADLWAKLPASERKITLATKFTLFRILAVPVIVYAMLQQWWGIAFGLFLAAALSDVVDGYLARHFGQASLIGACLDPLADKLLILAIYFTLAFVQSPLFTIPLWFVCLVLFKELLQIIGAIILLVSTNQPEIKPTSLGKLTMLVQVLFIVWLFSCYFFNWLPVKTYYAMLGAVLILVLGTLLHYSYRGLKQMFKLFILVLGLIGTAQVGCFELPAKTVTNSSSASNVVHSSTVAPSKSEAKTVASATTKPSRPKKSVGSVNNLKSVIFEQQVGEILKQLTKVDRLAVNFDLKIIDLREFITQLIESAMKDHNTKENLLRVRDRDQLVACVDNLDQIQARVELITEQLAAELELFEAEILALKKGVNSDMLKCKTK